MDRLVKAKIGGGPYRVVPGDVLELTMPAILRVVTAEGPGVSDQVTPYVCRVSEGGTIALPMVGEIKAAGKSLGQIESAVIDAYYPEYAVTRPSVVARVTEYRTAKVSVTGAVEKPGVYELRSDQMSLVALLMAAGGIIDEGASLIRIIHSEEPEEVLPDDEETLKQAIGETLEQTLLLINERAQKQAIERLIEPRQIEAAVSPTAYPSHNENIKMNSNAKLYAGNPKQNPTSGELLDKELLEILELEKGLQIRKKSVSDKPEKSEPFVLPVKGFNIPFSDVTLQDGDSVIVERLEQPLFTVLGLVSRPGNFPYPPDVRYNLMQAVGFAGGLDQAAEPRYATIYRLKPDGTIVSAIFKIIDGSRLTAASNTLIKPGDIVAIEHTPRTRTKLFLDRVFRINMGVYVPLYLLDNYR
jgi:protein involved in polysaccharide export with SLBB domain